MWFTSPSHNRPSSISGERRRAHGSPRRRTGFRPQTEALDERCLLSTLTVTNANDSGAGSLRAEIAAAKGGDTIVFAPSLDGQTITLTSGELYINKSLTISGPGAAQLTVSGGKTTRIFEVAAKNQLALSGLTISNGNGNAAGVGGGILNHGKLTVTSSTLSSNSSRDGGAIFNDGDGSTTISNCTLSGNTATYAGYGGAIYNAGSMTISNSTLSGNTVAPHFDGTYVGGYGGAIYFDGGSLSLSNSTLSNNTAPYGRGADIYMFRPTSNVTVSGCTLTDDVSGDFHIWVDGGTLTVKNSYFHGLSIYGPYIDGGGNTFA
jgi:parallel beta-helix repeat protein